MTSHHFLSTLQAVESAVAAAVLEATEQAVFQTKESDAMQQKAQQAAENTQAMRELEDRCQALGSQLEETGEKLHSAQTALRYGSSPKSLA